MNSNIDAYLQNVLSESQKALDTYETTISTVLPCFLFRELEAPNNRFVSKNDPFITSYKALSENQYLKPAIPRKIEYESAVYLKKGVIDNLYENSFVTLLFVGDGFSDMRFTYNCYRLFKTFGENFRIYSFICNNEIIGNKIGYNTIEQGWNNSEFGDKLFFHSEDWSYLSQFLENVISESPKDNRFLSIIDIDGTLLCPRPNYNGLIKNVRFEALKLLSQKLFDKSDFDLNLERDTLKLQDCYQSAAKTGFSKSYDDEDLTVLIALGLYAEIIKKDDLLLNPTNNLGFVVPVEWLQYASFQIRNSSEFDYKFSQLRSRYVKCIKAINDGLPSIFAEFREIEEEVLVDWANQKKIFLNKEIIKFLLDCAKSQVVPIGYSDRPNASVGLVSTGPYNITVESKNNAFINSVLTLV